MFFRSTVLVRTLPPTFGADSLEPLDVASLSSSTQPWRPACKPTSSEIFLRFRDSFSASQLAHKVLFLVVAVGLVDPLTIFS